MVLENNSLTMTMRGESWHLSLLVCGDASTAEVAPSFLVKLTAKGPDREDDFHNNCACGLIHKIAIHQVQAFDKVL